MFRRRPVDPAREALRAGFAHIAVHVDAAQRALLAAIPTARDPGVPLAQALAAFGEHLDAAAGQVRGWRHPAAAEHGRRCTEALTDARAAAERLRLTDGDVGFEALNARVGEVLDPLEVFADTERDLRRRR